ncbi:hypothetical protein ABIB83_008062 [Bradyrhizobium sp. I1.8.5]
MSTEPAQSPKWGQDRTRLTPDQARTVVPHPPTFDVAEAAKSADGPSDYLPGKWSWGPAKSSFDW